MLIFTRDIDKELCAAVQANDVSRCRRALEAGADVNGVTDTNNTRMLCYAIRAGASSELLKFLLDNGARVQPTDPAEVDPLYAAASRNDLELCKELVRRGANVNRQSDRGAAALHIAAGKAHVELCDYLLSNGADARLQYQLGLHPLHFAAKAPNSERSVETARLLIAHGANPSQLPDPAHPGDTTPCQHAAFTGNIMVLAYFLNECGEDPGQLTLDGRGLLDLASHVTVRESIRVALTERAVANSIGNEQTRVGCDSTSRSTSFSAL